MDFNQIYLSKEQTEIIDLLMKRPDSCVFVTSHNHHDIHRLETLKLCVVEKVKIESYHSVPDNILAPPRVAERSEFTESFYYYCKQNRNNKRETFVSSIISAAIGAAVGAFISSFF